MDCKNDLYGQNWINELYGQTLAVLLNNLLFYGQFSLSTLHMCYSCFSLLLKFMLRVECINVPKSVRPFQRVHSTELNIKWLFYVHRYFILDCRRLCSSCLFHFLRVYAYVFFLLLYYTRILFHLICNICIFVKSMIQRCSQSWKKIYNIGCNVIHVRFSFISLSLSMDFTQDTHCVCTSTHIFNEIVAWCTSGKYKKSVQHIWA